MNNGPLIFISAGDPSGDRNSAPLVKSITKNFPNVICTGLGGPAMEREGFRSRFEFSRFNRMGYVEVLKDLPFFLREKKRFIKMLSDEKPDILICVDYSGFNTPLMKAAKELDIPVLWYIAPMIWAWKKKKHGPRLGQFASHIATIFPFEVEHWKEFTPNVSYVGNPLLEEKALCNSVIREPLSNKNELVIALAPGSRTMELTRILPVMIKMVEKVKECRSQNIRFRVSCTEYLPDELYESATIAGIELFRGSLTELFQTSDIALVTSGTSTLHAALTGIPLLILYRSSTSLYLMVKLLTRTSQYSHIGLPNIMSSNEVAKEFIQNDLTANNLVDEISRLIDDSSYLNKRVGDMQKLQSSFGAKVPSEEMIPIISSLMEQKK